MKSKFVFVLVIFSVFLQIYTESLRGQNVLDRSKFQEEKETIEKEINSMLLGNYLRRLMLKVRYKF